MSAAVIPYAKGRTPNTLCNAKAKRGGNCRHFAGFRTDHPGVGRCYLHGGRTPIKHGLSSRYAFAHSRVGELLEQFAADTDPLNVTRELALARALLHDWVERYEAHRAQLEAWHASWEGKPLGEPQKAALAGVLDEYETLLREGPSEPTADELATLETARTAVAFLAAPPEKRPRHLLDVSDAMRHIDVISKVVYRIETLRQSGAISLDQLKRFLFGVERVIEMRVKDPELREKIATDILAIGV